MLPAQANAQSADDVTKLVERLVELDSIDVAKNVKYRADLEPPLFALDADESAMKVLDDPYEVFGRNKPAAAGWYRVAFTVPETLGKFKVPVNGYNLGVESNVQGAWEIYSYVNDKPAGSAMAAGVPNTYNEGNMLANARQPATAWMSNAPLPSKPGDKITIAILAMASPLGRGSPDGYALRHLRLRFALAHTGARQPFYGAVQAPGYGSGLLGMREMLAKREGAELEKAKAKFAGPIERLDLVFAAAETGQLDELTKAMRTASEEMNAAIREANAK
jgi:hypothetical protein